MNEYKEEMEIDYLLFTKTTLEHDKEPFNMKNFREYYTSFHLELREEHLLSRNIITSITSNFSFIFNIFLKIIRDDNITPSIFEEALISSSLFLLSSHYCYDHFLKYEQKK